MEFRGGYKKCAYWLQVIGQDSRFEADSAIMLEVPVSFGETFAKYENENKDKCRLQFLNFQAG